MYHWDMTVWEAISLPASTLYRLWALLSPIKLIKIYHQYVALSWAQCSTFFSTTKSLGLNTPIHASSWQPSNSICHCCSQHGNTAIIKLSSSEYLSSTNWIVWCKWMIIMVELCKVYEYTQGLVEKPNSLMDPQGAKNWMKNDNYAKHLLSSNISTTEMMNLGWPGIC